MKKYDNYKDSGIEWIGEIPNHWEVKRLKNIGKLYSGLSGKSGSDFEKAPTENYKPFINFTNIANNKYIVNDNFGYVKIDENENQNKVKKNDLFFLMSSENQEDVGKSSLLVDDYEELYLNSFCKGFRLNTNSDARFLNYLLSSSALSQLISLEGRGFTRINLRMEGVENLPILIPKLQEEQTAIANYLDHKTSQIDTLIAKKEQFISLLQEERTALINQAVTKGLDPKVKMKDSGIEWLGEIPENWEVKKLKYLCKIINEKSSEKPDYVLALENIKSWTGEIVGNPYENKMEGDVNLFKENDILFNKLRPYLAKVIKTQSDGGCVGELLVLRANKFLTPTFLYYRLISEAIITIVDNSTYGTKMPRASWEKFISLIGIGFPSIDEQNKITDYIENKIREIETLVSKTQQEIELLKEYKTALISEVVTGKVDVRE